MNRLGFEEWFAANRESLTAEFSPSKDEAEITVIAMKKYRTFLKVRFSEHKILCFVGIIRLML